MAPKPDKRDFKSLGQIVAKTMPTLGDHALATAERRDTDSAPAGRGASPP